MTKCLKNLEKIEATLAIDACKHARDQKSVTTRCRGLLSKVDTPCIINTTVIARS